MQEKGITPAKYEHTRTGPSHLPTFFCTGTFYKITQEATGNTKAMAEQLVAEKIAYELFKKNERMKRQYPQHIE